MSEIPYLGYLITKDGTKPDPKKISVIKDWPTPTSVFDVRSFLGLANYFRRYINHFSEMASPLINLTKGNISKRTSSKTNIQWNTECQRSFDELKVALTSSSYLVMPDFTKPFEVITNAADFAQGAVLLQEGKAVAYESRVLNGAEKNYHATNRELLAVIHALKVWRCYLEGSTFKVLTDHNPLCHLPTQPLLSRRQARWSEFLQQFKFGWEYKPGIDNPADSLSRLCVFTATPGALRSKHYVRFHPQLIRGVGALGSDMVTPIQVKD
jgi:hypothetical protein